MKITLPKFKTQADLFNYLVAHKEEIVDLKKSERKDCDSVDWSEAEFIEAKALTNKKQDTENEIYRTIVGNTYYWLDSHEDVHVENCFTASIKQRTAKRISHLHDHKQQLDAKVGKFEDVYEAKMPWRDLGVNRDGETVALLGDSAIKRGLNQKVFDMYLNGEVDQHSVGMIYDKIELAINDPERPKEYALWLSIYPMLGNPEKADKLGYLWVVKSAKLIEISAVLNGSNEITPTLPSGPAKASTEVEDKTDPLEGSQTVKSNYYYYH